MTSQTPIFDALVDKFNKSGVYEFGFVYENEPREVPQMPTAIDVPESISSDGISFMANLGAALAQDEPEEETTAEMPTIEEESTAMTHRTLYDATNLATVKPAIPEMVKMPHGPTSVAETLKQADEELGIDDLDKAFEEADRVLEPHTTNMRGIYPKQRVIDETQALPSVIATTSKKATPAQMAEVKRKLETGTIEVALPKRQNKRNNRNRNRTRSGGTANKAA